MAERWFPVDVHDPEDESKRTRKLVTPISGTSDPVWYRDERGNTYRQRTGRHGVLAAELPEILRRDDGIRAMPAGGWTDLG